MKSLDREELKQLLIKGWMTHDAMWFRHCVEVCGIEQTNRINKAAVRSMAAVEIRRLTKALGVDEVGSMDTLRELIEAAWQLIKADFMDFTYSYPAPNSLDRSTVSPFSSWPISSRSFVIAPSGQRERWAP